MIKTKSTERSRKSKKVNAVSGCMITYDNRKAITVYI